MNPGKKGHWLKGAQEKRGTEKSGTKKGAHSFWKRGKRAQFFLSNYETKIIDSNQLINFY